MAKQPSFLDLLYLGNAPKTQDQSLDPFAADRKKVRRGKPAPRDFSVPRTTSPEMYAPRQGVIDRVYDALNQLSPGLGEDVKAPVEAIVSPAGVENALRRGYEHLRGGDVYASNPDLQAEDAMLLGITGAAPGVMKGLGAAGRGLAALAPEAIRAPVSRLAARGADWARERAPLMSVGEHPLPADPGFVEAPFAVRPGPRQLETSYVAPQRVSGPARMAALPAPGPGLPEFAAKPRGGQWWADREIMGTNYSPENAARESLPVGLLFSSDARDKALREWWQRAVPKYLKTDFAGPSDPLRSLAERGLLHVPDMGAEDWSKLAGESFIEDPLQQVLYGARGKPGSMPGAGDDFRGEVMAAMPWLAKVPSTENLYGVSRNSLSGLEFPHVADELRNAMSVAGDIPADLAVRPESLQRMSFPQAVEHVGRINQWRAKQAEQAALSAMDSPAVQTFKEYPENNPTGLRWVELRAPEDLTAGYQFAPEGGGSDYTTVISPEGGVLGAWPTSREARAEALRHAGSPDLQQALKYEGDVMGHCVGGYCDDVLTGRSRIFSLRDAKGEPHVTIETQPGQLDDLRSRVPMDVQQQIADQFGGLNTGPNFNRAMVEWAQDNLTPPENIVQIKGKQNRAPKEDYLPFVQDFVKSGKWGSVGDLGNTDLVKLPDGRYITKAQMQEGMASARDAFPDANVGSMLTFNWPALAPHFEGYKDGGLVVKKACSCHDDTANFRVKA